MKVPPNNGFYAVPNTIVYDISGSYTEETVNENGTFMDYYDDKNKFMKSELISSEPNNFWECFCSDEFTRDCKCSRN